MPFEKVVCSLMIFVKIKVILGATVSRPVCSFIKPPSRTRDQLSFHFHRFVIMERPLWWKGGSVICRCCWASPAQSLSGLSTIGPMSIFYCLHFAIPPTWRDRRIAPSVAAEVMSVASVGLKMTLHTRCSSGYVCGFSRVENDLTYLLQQWLCLWLQ
jgi:hypothetical protein